MSTADPTPTLVRARAIGWALCTMDVSVSSMCDSTTTSFQLVNNDDDCVIVQSAEHAARTLLSFRTCRVVDGGTQCMPLSAAVNNPRSAGRVEGPYSMLQVIGVRKPVSRLPRGDCSDQHCCPERAWCAVALSMLE